MKKYQAALEDIDFAIRLRLYASGNILYGDLPLKDTSINELLNTYFKLKEELNNDELSHIDEIDECDLDDLNL